MRVRSPCSRKLLVLHPDPWEPRDADGTTFYEFVGWRWTAPHLLAEWEPPGAASAIRAALVAWVHAEQETLIRPTGPEEVFIDRMGMGRGRKETGEQAWSSYYFEQGQWVEYEHSLVYALGRLGAFGALTGIKLPPGVYWQWAGTKETGENGEYRFAQPKALDQAETDHADRFRGYLWRVHACLGALEPTVRQVQKRFVSEFAEVPESPRQYEPSWKSSSD